MVRPTAHLLVIMMLLASGRLLACGLECLDELATPEVASCHDNSPTDREGLPTVALAKVGGDASHACPPDVAEPLVRFVKTLTAQDLAAAPLAAPLITPEIGIASSTAHLHSYHLRHESPHLATLSVLRI